MPVCSVLLVYEPLVSVSGATIRATKCVRMRCVFLFRSRRFTELETGRSSTFHVWRPIAILGMFGAAVNAELNPWLSGGLCGRTQYKTRPRNTRNRQRCSRAEMVQFSRRFRPKEPNVYSTFRQQLELANVQP